MGTFGDDPTVREHNVLSAAAGDSSDRGMQPQTLLDAHGEEGQLRQVVPEKKPQPAGNQVKVRALQLLCDPVKPFSL